VGKKNGNDEKGMTPPEGGPCWNTRNGIESEKVGPFKPLSKEKVWEWSSRPVKEKNGYKQGERKRGATEKGTGQKTRVGIAVHLVWTKWLKQRGEQSHFGKKR